MLRSVLVSLCRFLLRIFFRRIEVVGRHHLPEDGSLLFALNHPSGLIDPLFILCLSERRVSFLAKEPLFRMPVIGTFVKAFESLPVYRSQDGGDPQKNRAMMTAASELLARGNALALFPEGTSHSDPKLKRFRSGAARIALSARSLGKRPVRIVPAAIYYEKKQTFRSRAVLAFGPPLEMPEVELDEAGDSPIEVGKELTKQLQRSVEAIMPTADTAEDLILLEQAERVLSAAVRDTPEQCEAAAHHLLPRGADSPRLALGDRMARRRHLLDKYIELVEHEPQAVAALIQKLRELGDELEAAGLPIDAAPGSKRPLRKLTVLTVTGALLFPLALLGALLHAPAYQLIRYIAFRYAGEHADVTATVKLISGLLFFPLTWTALGAVGSWLGNSPWGWIMGAAGPLLGWSAIGASEIYGSLMRSSAARRRAQKAGLDWPSLVSRRAEVVQEMGRLVAMT